MGRSSQMNGLGNKMGKSNARILRLVQLYSVSSSLLVLSVSFFFIFFFEKKGNLTARMRRLGQLCFVASQPVVAVGVFGLLEKQMLICIFHIFGRSMTIKYFLITCKMWSLSSCVCVSCVCVRERERERQRGRETDR